MKRALLTVLLLLPSIGCASPEQLAAADRLAAASTAAVDPSGPGGAVVTPEEQAELTRLFQELQGAQGVNWRQVLATLVATLGTAAVAAVPGLKYGLPLLLERIPNSKILGKDAANALADIANGKPAAPKT